MPPKKVKPGRPRKSIHVFDLDDTLIQTEAKIRLLNAEGHETRSLTPSQFTTYVLQVGENFDFRDFSDVGILARGVVLKYTRDIIETILKRGTQSDFGILTARGDKRLHAPFLIRLFKALFGIRLRNARIFALSDARFLKHKQNAELPDSFSGQSFAELSIPERKALVIGQDLASRGYNDISLYDDSRENLNAFKVIRKAFPEITYKPHFIDPTWHLRLEEFRLSELPEKSLTRGVESARLILENHSRFRENPEEGLRTLEKAGQVPLESGLLLRKDGAKFLLAKKD